MTPSTSVHRVPVGQSGIALIVALVILAVLSLIGVAAFSISTQEERMAGNSRDRIRAFEAAETALRACELLAASGAPFGGTPGLYPSPGSTALPGAAEGLSDVDWQNPAKVNLLPPNGSALGPSCVAEEFTLPNSNWSPGQSLGPTNSTNVAHVTSRGYGVNQNTVVRLESYYAL